MNPQAWESVLITGGSGYLGRALTKALLELPSVKRICIYSRGEASQASMRAMLPDPEGRLRFFIGDVRDKSRLKRAMQGLDMVVHAAALKRIEVGEYNPEEMMLTNVLGAMNVIEAAQETQVYRVVAVSSDKACAPLNAYGASKLCMEKLMLAANYTGGVTGPKFAVVRYGNVAGSTGSVIPIWRQMIRDGVRKVPVTNPDCRRFFMLVDEAVELILWTLREMWGGETVVPLLPAFTLTTLAEAMGVEMDINGMGSGEKLDEMMIAMGESASFRFHAPYLVRGGLAQQYPQPNINGVRVHMLSVAELKELLEEVR